MFGRRSSISLWGLLFWCWCLCLFQSASAASKPTHQDLNEQYGGVLTDSKKYLYGSDQWGDDGSGSQEMTVLLADEHGASFNATWIWEKNFQYVHAYPNVGYESAQLPTKLSNVKAFHLSGSWSVYPEGQEDAPDKTAALNAIACKADIALDIFMDANETSAMNASRAAYEVMVWQSVWGGVWPIGYYEPPVGAPEYNLSGVTYQLFMGRNQQGQQQSVFSWVPTVYQESIDAEIFELVNELVRIGNITSDMYMGVIQFGSETVHAAKKVVLEMNNIEMKLDVKTTKTVTSRPTATSRAAADVFRAQITNFAVPAALGLGAMLVV